MKLCFFLAVVSMCLLPSYSGIPRAMTLEERKRIDQLPPAARPAAIKSILRESEQTGTDTAIDGADTSSSSVDEDVPEWKRKQERLRAKSREKLERKEHRQMEREERQAEREAEREADRNDVENISSSSSTAAAGGGGDVPRAMSLEERRGVDQVGNTVGADVKGHEVQGVRENRLRGPSTGGSADASTSASSNDAAAEIESLRAQLAAARSGGGYVKLRAGDDCPSVLPDIAEAMKNADQEMVKCIVKAQMGGGITIPSKSSSSSCSDDYADDALFNAATKAELDVARCLIGKGANIDLTFKKGRTALMEACRGGEKAKEIVEILLDAGSKLNIQDDRGKTALMYAAHQGVDVVVNTLIGRGARVDVVDEDGKTATMIAFDNSHTNVVAAIENAVCSKFMQSCLKDNKLCGGPLALNCLGKSKLKGWKVKMQIVNSLIRY